MIKAVDFYVDVNDPTVFSCRLLRKVHSLKQRTLVTGEASRLQLLDSKLWTFQQLSFIPHCFLDDELAEQTPVLFALEVPANSGFDCLLNLGSPVQESWASYPRLLEVVGTDPADKVSARARFRQYRDMDFEVRNHTIDE